MSRILADKVTNYNNDGPFEAEQGIEFPLNRPISIAGTTGSTGQYLTSTGNGLVWTTAPQAFSGDYNDLGNKPALFSGDYGDLSNKPTVLNLSLDTVTADQYLRYDGASWVNTDFPAVNQYSLDIGAVETNVVKVNLYNTTTDSITTPLSFAGGENVVVSYDPGENRIEIVGDLIQEYGATQAITDVGDSLEINPFHEGIYFDRSFYPTSEWLASTEYEANDRVTVDIGASTYTYLISVGGTSGTTAPSTTTPIGASETLDGVTYILLSDDENYSTPIITAVNQRTYEIYGNSTDGVDNDVNIGLNKIETNPISGGISTDAGFITLKGENGVTISWDDGTSTASISYTESDPYTLPAASTTTLGGVKVDGSTITIDGNNIITANFVDTGINYTDLSVTVVGTPTASGGLTYDDTDGTFSFTPVSTLFADIVDITVPATPVQGDVLHYSGGNFIVSPLSDALDSFSIRDFGDVNDAAITDGHYLVWVSALNEFQQAAPIAYHGANEFSGYPTPTNASISYADGDVIKEHTDTTDVTCKYLVRPGYASTEITAVINSSSPDGGNLVLQRRLDEYDPVNQNWTQGTYTDVMDIYVSDVRFPIPVFYRDVHGGDTNDYVYYRLVSSGNTVVYYGSNNALAAKQMTEPTAN